MKKDAYKDIFQGWIAKAAEYKMALGIAVVCTVIILISLLWPKPKPGPTISAINSTPPASHVYTAPSESAPATAPPPAPQKMATPPPPAASPMEKELAAKPLFPPAPATPAPKPQALPAPKPAAPAATPTAVSLPAGWYVQLGSFQDKQRAIALAGKVEDKHWQSRIAPRPGGLHAVWVGPYPTRAAAEKAKLTLKKDIGISGFPVQSP